jgi:penicillin-binding protein 2
LLRTSDFDPISVEIFNRQLKNITLLVMVVFGVLILRLWFLQVVNGTKYRTSSENNRIHLYSIPPFRGIIFDRNGEMLVGNRPSFDLYAIPEEVQDQDQLLIDLNHLIGLPSEVVAQRLDRAPRRYPFRPVCLKKDISRDELAVIETHGFNLPGIIIKVRPLRHYVHGNLLSHLLGYLGEISEKQLKSGQYANNNPGDLIGRSGVERKWQSFLHGMQGGEQVEVDASGRKIRVISRRSPIPGENICLTIDKGLQVLAEKALIGQKGAIVAIDPNNGEVLALASSPSFDPNLFVTGIDKSSWTNIATSKDYPLQNRALSSQYPPGSAFKIIVFLAGLQEGLINPEEEIFCSGRYSLGSDSFYCWKKHGHGKVNLQRALTESCDIYFYNLGKRLGVDKIAEYARKLGLGRKTGLDLGQEKEGLVPTSGWKLRRFGVPWQAGETISLSIGQSFVLVTPVQMATMISAIFNGGNLYRPRLTKWIGKTESKKIQESLPKLTKKLEIEEAWLELVKKALIGAVNEPHGTGSQAKLKGTTVAGKTGTAQVVALEKEKELSAEGEVPARFRDHAWFVSVAPADSPKIALAVVIEHGGHGGSVAAPIARELIRSYLGLTE